MPGSHSRDKGAVGEREARDAVRQHWHARDCIRASQANGKWSADLLLALPSAHIEVKRYSAIAPLKWLRRAESEAPDGSLPAVLLREDGDTEWACLLRVADCVGLAERLASNMGRPVYPVETWNSLPVVPGAVVEDSRP